MEKQPEIKECMHPTIGVCGKQKQGAVELATSCRSASIGTNEPEQGSPRSAAIPYKIKDPQKTNLAECDPLWKLKERKYSQYDLFKKHSVVGYCSGHALFA